MFYFLASLILRYQLSLLDHFYLFSSTTFNCFAFSSFSFLFFHSADIFKSLPYARAVSVLGPDKQDNFSDSAYAIVEQSVDRQ